MAKKDSKQTGKGVGLPVGSKIGNYEIRERTAIGGQAIIYKGYDPMLDRYVAVKQISTHLAEDPKFLERFRKEAQIIAKLGAEQPAIVSIHEMIEDEKGLFIVMEFVPGHSLETILQDTDGPVEPKAVLQVIWRLAAGLNAVHAAGIVHRDIKPGNIIIGESLRTKITDFGVAASITGQTSLLMGTTKYMAPELFTGETIDGRADMYSLGFIAYEMLTGRPKFNEIFADIVRDKRGEPLRWMKWHGNAQVQAPPLNEVNPSIPAVLSDIVAKMIAKNPDDRFQSMEALGREIKANFSSRARAAQPRAGMEPAARRREPTSAALKLSESIAPEDEADRLDVVAEALPTAPLPKTQLSVRTKLILTGVIAASIIGIGIILAMKLSETQRERLSRAGDAYTRALTQYETGAKDYDVVQLASALKGFQQVREEYKNTEYATKASVLEALAEAHVAVLEREWEKGQKAHARAGERLELAKKDSRALSVWGREIQTELEQFERYLSNSWRFWDAMERAENALKAKSFEEVRKILEDRVAGMELKNPELVRKLAEFKQTLNVTEFNSGFSNYLTQGDALADKGDFDEAKRRYQSAKSMLESPEVEVLPKTTRDALQKTWNNRSMALEARRAYGQGMETAEGARQKQQKDEELIALVAASKNLEDLARLLGDEEVGTMEREGKIKPLIEIKQRIQSLRAEIALKEALEHLGGERYDEAIKKFESSLGYKRTDEAATGLKQAKEAKQFKSLMDEGKKHEEGGQLAEALKTYTQAQGIRPDDTALKGKITDIRYQIQLAEADRLRGEKEYDKAGEAYERAREINPEASSEIDAHIVAMKQAQRYDGLLSDGDDALKQKKWSDALRYFSEAKGIRDTEEVRKRINLTRYSENVIHGETAMKARDYGGALAYFKLAQGFMDTPEIAELIEKAEKAAQE